MNLNKFEVLVSLSTASIGYTMKVLKGSAIPLPCHFPLSSQVTADALWFKETGVGKRMQLIPRDDSTGDNNRVEQLYPLDHDQTIILRDTVMEDAGIYQCESVDGKKLSTVYVIVEGMCGNLFYNGTINYYSKWKTNKLHMSINFNRNVCIINTFAHQGYQKTK